MKKRRELDALVNGKIGRRKKYGEHELLRNESESSEIEEFSIDLPQKTVVRKRQTTRVCATCLVVLGFLLLVACIVAVAGLVWVHIKLQQDVDLLKVTIQKVQTGNRLNPENFHDVHEKLKLMQQNVDDLQQQLTTLVTVNQMAAMNATINRLNKTTQEIKNAKTYNPDLSNDIESLQKSVADSVSEIQSLRSIVEDLLTNKKESEKEMDKLREEINSQGGKTAEEEGGRSLEHITEGTETTIQKITAGIAEMNSTMIETMSFHEARLNQIGNRTELLDSRLQLLELKPTAPAEVNKSEEIVPNMEDIVQEAVNSVMDGLKNVSNDGLKQAEKALVANLTHRLEDVEGRLNSLENISHAVIPTAEGTSADSDSDVMEFIGRLNVLEQNFTQYTVLVDGVIQAINSTAWSAHEHTDRVEDKVTNLSQQILVFHDLLTRTTPISAPAQETVLEDNQKIATTTTFNEAGEIPTASVKTIITPLDGTEEKSPSRRSVKEHTDQLQSMGDDEIRELLDLH